MQWLWLEGRVLQLQWAHGGDLPKGTSSLVDVSDTFYFFCSGGGGKGSSRRRDMGKGVDFLLKIPGGVSRKGRAEGPGGCLRRIGEFGGGGANFFFLEGRNVH